MTETQTPPPACDKCGDTGTIPPFMDACTCGAMPTKYAPEFAAPSVVELDEFRPTIPGTTIPTPGFPVGATIGEIHRHTNGNTYLFTGFEWTAIPSGFPSDPAVGDISWKMGKAYAWDGTEWRQFDTEALTYEQFHARYGPDAVLPEFVVEREADDAALFARRAAEMEIEANTAAWDAPESTWSGGATWGAPSLPAGSHVDWSGVLPAADDKVTAAGPEIDWSAVLPEPAPVATATPTPVPLRRKPASAPQGALLARLIAERDPANVLVQAAKSECTGPEMTAKRASQLIDALLKLPVVKPTHRPNSYDGACVKCGGNVPSKTGRIEKSPSTGRWQTFHLTAADCITEAEKAVLEADRVDEPGLYRLVTERAIDSTDIYRVRKARTSERLYGEKVVTHTHTHPDGTTHTDVSFVYNGNAMRFLRKCDKLTWSEARAFGKAYGACVACGRTLNDPRSLVQSYGPTCAKKYHWPTVTLKQAEAIIAGTVTWEEVTGTLTVL